MLSLLILSALISQVLGRALITPRQSNSGQATFYTGNVAGGTCSFSTYTLPAGLYGTALSSSNWDNAANCGACVSVTGPGGNSVTAMIVDQCPSCGTNHLDLFPNAFAALAAPVKGIINVNWNIVDCPISSPLQLHNKDGASQYYFSMQVVNAAKAVQSLDVSTDGGNTWRPTSRKSYNFFELGGGGAGAPTASIRVTSTGGQQVIVNNVDLSSGSSTTASRNF